MTSSKVCVLSLLSICAIAYGARQDFLWTVSLTVSDTPGGEYEGEIELLAVFKDKTQHSTTLPKTKYELGQTYTFDIRLTSADALETVYLRTKGFCPLGLLPNDLLRLRQVDLVSRSTSTAYSKQVDDLAIKDACQNSRGTAFIGFTESTVSPCLVEGRKYDHGQRFDLGCTGRCKCDNGSVACVDMCPAVAWEADQKCHFVRVPGECCDQVVCEEDEKLKSCQEHRPGKVVAEDNKAVHRYPWSVLYCTDVNCTQIHGGMIIGDKHILTFAPDLSDQSQLFVASNQYIVDQGNISEFTTFRIANTSTHPDFINRNSPIADSASRLQVVELDRRFQFDRHFQTANLPFDKNHCLHLSKNECPIMTVGWDRTDDSQDEIRQWFLHGDQTKRDDTLCQSNSTSRNVPRVRRRGDKRACIGGLVRTDCTGPLAGAVIANAASIDFVVGITDPDSALFFCDHPGTADVLPLCKYVEWVNAITAVSF